MTKNISNISIAIWSKNIKAFAEFVNDNKRLPKRKEKYKDKNLWSWIDNQRNTYKGHGTCIPLNDYQIYILDKYFPEWLSPAKYQYKEINIDEFNKDLEDLIFYQNNVIISSTTTNNINEIKKNKIIITIKK